MSERSRSTLITNILLAGCAVVQTVIAVRREYGAASAASQNLPAVQALDNWRSLLDSGHRIGPKSAQVEILVFGDFECPVCGGFTRRSLQGVLANFPNEVGYTFRHWPLSYHRFAYPAARASECAARQGRFTEFHDNLYRLQDSLGLIPFREFALRSNVEDLAAFEKCNSDVLPVLAIEADRRVADSLHFAGTPTLIIDGDLYRYAPDSAQLHKIIEDRIDARAKE